MVSAVGTDALGDRALKALADRQVHCEFVARDAQRATGQVHVTLNSEGVAQYEIALDAAWDHVAWTGELATLARRCDAVCFGSLGQRSPTARATIRRFVEAVPRGSLRVFDVNLRQHFYDHETVDASMCFASAVKLNDEELPVIAELCGIESRATRDMLRELMARYDLRLAALTRGPRGALLLDDRGEDDCATPALAAADTVGAGDAFTAALVSGFLRGLPLALINRHANTVASFVCSRAGATPPLPEYLRTFA